MAQETNLKTSFYKYSINGRNQLLERKIVMRQPALWLLQRLDSVCGRSELQKI